MKIAYVNVWPGFELNDYPQRCYFSRILKEVDQNLKIDVGLNQGEKYDLIVSMFRPMAGSPTYADMTRVDGKSLCFTGESYDLIGTTPGCGAYVGFDHPESILSGIKYLRFPLYAMYHQDHLDRHGCASFEELQSRFKRSLHDGKFSAVVSNPHNQLRTEVIRILTSLGLCDSAGAVHNTIGSIGWDDPNAKISLISKSMYSLAFENTSKVGYITEKIYECFLSGSVPYYWGAPDIIAEFNPANYHVFDSSSIEAARASLKRMISVLQDTDLRRSMETHDPFMGYRSEVYIKDGKNIMKEFIMNHIESR